MKWLITFVFVWVSVSAIPWCGQQLPSHEPECPPEVLPTPEPIEVVGLLTQLINKLKDIGDSENGTKSILALQQKKNDDFITFIRESGGPGFNICAKINFFKRQANEFWNTIQSSILDIYWQMEQAFSDAIETIKREFRLVIDQPQVQSWLRELLDVPRISVNLSLQSLESHRRQWIQLAMEYQAKLATLVRNGLCHNANELQNRFYRVLRIGLTEGDKVIIDLIKDQLPITENAIKRGLELANKIYQVEILALKYFVS